MLLEELPPNTPLQDRQLLRFCRSIKPCDLDEHCLYTVPLDDSQRRRSQGGNSQFSICSSTLYIIYIQWRDESKD